MEKYTFANKIGTFTVQFDYNKIIKFNKSSSILSKSKPSASILKFVRDFNKYLLGESISFREYYSLDGSSFTKKVLTQIALIKYGETISYKELAIRSGYPKAYRAVGSVCRNNKLPIIIPCHRVIKSDGSIGNYSLGKDIKKHLLDLESNYIID